MTTEAERQFYLSQMGVHLWYARDPLPGAAPSPDFDFAEPESEPSASPSEAVRSAPTVTRSAEDRAAAQGNVRDLLKSIGGQASPREDKPAPKEKPKAAAPEPASIDQVPSPQARGESEVLLEERLAELDGAKLDLGFWVSDRYCLTSALSSDVSEELQGQLAANILRALGSGVSNQKRFVWPVFNNQAVMKNALTDLEYLLGRLEKDVVGDRTLIGLGPLADTEQQHQALMARLGTNTVCGEQGLAALAADPRSKQALWRTLREQLLGG